ncbi:MAG: Dna2/Cas4 domain-containing protein [Methanospirillum sp.]|uniref:CRISPR-associated protein Cas4 n=1 Tax=Methanospirillum sp. TaxID=45200 RepID=UPI00236BA948|nr:Dna2/Cas4 domain-containing protein [Methanospirillum sp.]MDD1729474.1 Dna2/Cas4 domain-containing protein [Methanospirillum sp.]
MTESSETCDNAIPISSVIQAYRCPRRFYFSRHDKIVSTGRYTICKQISLNIVHPPDEDALWDEICLIEPTINPDMREYLSHCLVSTAHTPLPTWTDSDIAVNSKRYGIYGQIDKYDAQSGSISVIRNSGSPSKGCWSDDRIRLAAYLLCLRESRGIDLSGGYVEYIPDGIVRYYEPQPRDRRGLIQALVLARKVLSGNLPAKPVHAPCTRCTYQKQCNPEKPTLLSHILFKKR